MLPHSSATVPTISQPHATRRGDVNISPHFPTGVKIKRLRLVRLRRGGDRGFGNCLCPFKMSSLAAALVACAAAGSPAPDPSNKAATARYLVHASDYGVLATNSLHLPGVPFSNIFSFADGTPDNSTGNVYFFASPLDTSMHDLAVDPRCSFSLTESQIGTNLSCGSQHIDPEDPRCARLTLSGKFADINATAEGWNGPAMNALFARHPEMTQWVADGFHDFGFYKLTIENIWLIDFYGGAAAVTPAEYYAASPPAQLPKSPKSAY